MLRSFVVVIVGICLLLASSLVLGVEDEYIEWEYEIMAEEADRIVAVEKYKETSVVILAKSDNENDWILLMTDNDGELVWSYTHDDDFICIPEGLLVSPTGEILVVGYSEKLGVSGGNAFLMCFDRNGQLNFEELYGGMHYESFTTIMEADNGYLMIGEMATESDEADLFVVKINKFGDEKWQKTYPLEKKQMIRSSLKARGNQYYISMQTVNEVISGRIVDTDVVIKKIDKNGLVIWSDTIGADTKTYAHEMYETEDRDLILLVSSYPLNAIPSYSKTDAYVFKYNMQGEIQWTSVLGGYNQDRMWYVKECPDGGFILGGYSDSYVVMNPVVISDTGGYYDAWIAKIDVNGITQWQKLFGRGQRVELHDIELTESGFLVGAYKDESSSIDYWVLYLDSMGEIISELEMDYRHIDNLHSIIPIRENKYFMVGLSSIPDKYIQVFMVKE